MMRETLINREGLPFAHGGVQNFGNRWIVSTTDRVETGGAVWREQSNSDTDYYGQKLRYYELRIKDLEKQITAADLTGNKPGAQGYRAVTIYRG